MIVIILAVACGVLLSIGFALVAVPLGFISAGLCCGVGAGFAEWLLERRQR